jgi:hypothetical protein
VSLARPIPAEVIDREPANEGELWDRREFLNSQVRQLGGAVLKTPVTCPCGTTVALHSALQCFYCGIYFCRTCAGRHFSEDRP